MLLTVPVLKYSSVLNIESATGAKTPSSVPRERLDDSSPRPPSGPRDSSSERRLPQQMNQLKIVEKKFCSVCSSDLSSGKVSPKLLYPLLLARASSITLSSSTVIFLGGYLMNWKMKLWARFRQHQKHNAQTFRCPRPMYMYISFPRPRLARSLKGKHFRMWYTDATWIHKKWSSTLKSHM